MDALAVELLMPRSMARSMLAASLLNLSFLKPPSSPGEGEMGPRTNWQWSRKAELYFCGGENFPLFSLAITEVAFQGRENSFSEMPSYQHDNIQLLDLPVS